MHRLGLLIVAALMAAWFTVRPYVHEAMAQSAVGTGSTSISGGIVMTMPFQRMGAPVILPASTTPQQYAIEQPPGSSAYRLVNPCRSDILIRTVPDMETTVTEATGTLFLARSVETLASSPALSNPRIVSIVALRDTGAEPCRVRLGYGRSS